MARFPKFRSGQVLDSLSASWLNSLVDLDYKVNMLWKKFGSGRSYDKYHQEPSLVYIYNASGEFAARWNVFGIDGVLSSYTDTPQAFEANHAVLKGILPTSDHIAKFCIAMEDIPAERIGRAVLVGYCTARVDMQSATDQYAEPEPSNCINLVSKSSGGSAQIIYSEASTELGGSVDGTGLQWCLVRYPYATASAAVDPILFVLRSTLNSGQRRWAFAELLAIRDHDSEVCEDDDETVMKYVCNRSPRTYCRVFDPGGEFTGTVNFNGGFCRVRSETPTTLQHCCIDPEDYTGLTLPEGAVWDPTLREIERISCANFASWPCANPEADPCAGV